MSTDKHKLYAVEFFRTPKFIHFLGEHHRVLKKRLNKFLAQS